MINVKLTMHLMPWEIDNALITYTQLKKSHYYLPNDVNITIETVLNLSSKLKLGNLLLKLNLLLLISLIL